MTAPKVFCIGFQKTGTSSLGLALQQLGYSVAGYHPFRDLATHGGLDLETIWARAGPIAASHDAVQDTPWPVLYDRLDRAFPGAKFIHVVRDRDAWIRSVLQDFRNSHNEIHRLIYGSDCPVANEEAWLARYDRHNAEVRAYFADRQEDLLSIDLASIGWAPVCAFLGHPPPEGDVPWPHVNTYKQKHGGRLWQRATRRARRWLSRGTH